MFRQKEKKIKPLMPPVTRGCTGGKRLLVVVSIVLIIFSLFAFPVSADSDITNIDKTFGDFNLDYITIVAYDSSGNLVDIYNVEVVDATDGNSRGLKVDVESHETFLPSQQYTLAVGLKLSNGKYNDSTKSVKGSYLLGLNNEKFDMLEVDMQEKGYLTSYCERRYEDENKIVKYREFGKMTFKPTSYTEYALSSFGYSELGDIFNIYLTKVIVEPIKQFNTFSFFLYDFNFEVLTENQIHDEQIKQEATESGDSGASDVANAIPNHSGKLITAFGYLKESICHSRTDCGFYSPAIKIPKIKGFINEEITLMEPKWISLDVYFNQLSGFWGNILTLVKSILGGALILYCVKELYKLIEYVLTLRGDDDG